jgi:hypothetical protein
MCSLNKRGVLWVESYSLVAQCGCGRATTCIFAQHQLPLSGARCSQDTGRVTCPWCHSDESGLPLTRVAELTWTQAPVDWALAIQPLLLEPPGLLEFSTVCLQAGLTSDGREPPDPEPANPNQVTFYALDLTEVVQDALHAVHFDVASLRTRIDSQADQLAVVYDVLSDTEKRVLRLELALGGETRATDRNGGGKQGPDTNAGPAGPWHARGRPAPDRARCQGRDEPQTGQTVANSSR